MASLLENADTHYREALDCLNEVQGPRLDALTPQFQQEAYHNLVLASIAHSLTGILALHLDAAHVAGRP